MTSDKQKDQRDSEHLRSRQWIICLAQTIIIGSVMQKRYYINATMWRQIFMYFIILLASGLF